MKKLLVVLGLVLSLSAPASAGEEHSKLNHALILSNLALNGVENGQSLYLFAKYPTRFREANPALRWAQHDPTLFGATKMGTQAGISALNLWLERKYPKSKGVRIMLVTQNLLMGALVIRNARLGQ